MKHEYPEGGVLELDWEDLKYNPETILERGTLRGWFRLKYRGHTGKLTFHPSDLAQAMVDTGFTPSIEISEHEGYGSNVSLMFERPLTPQEIEDCKAISAMKEEEIQNLREATARKVVSEQRELVEKILKGTANG